jgi:hypothetical protein
MSTHPTLHSLLQQIAQLKRMEPGKLCVMRQGPDGPYYSLQCREGGKPVARYVPREEADLVAMEQLQGVNGIDLVHGRKTIAGSMIGGIAETQQVVDYCAARNIKADIELIQPKAITRAYERVVNKDVRYRFVIDFASSKPKEEQ